MDTMIHKTLDKEGSLEVETKVYISEDCRWLEIYQYLYEEEPRFSESGIVSSCVRIPSSEIVKIIKAATEYTIKNASKFQQ
jgi:hypothetical protein